MKNSGHNLLDTFLEQLKVKHTKSFTDKLFNEHPHKYNLFGLSKMLSDFGIENAAIRIAEKEKDISAVEMPFIAQFGGEFVIVRRVEDSTVFMIRNEKETPVPSNTFLEGWSGVTLLAETTEKSGEPDFAEHRKKELLQSGRKYLLYAALGVFALSAFFIQSLSRSLSFVVLLLLNFFGTYISWLLVLKQMHIGSRYADKICSLFNHHDCNNILESPAAKLLGVLGWSEIGLGYFAFNILILLISPDLVSLLAIINLFALPYTAWSVWYQKAKAKQWCVLCLIVQVLLWLTFSVHLISGRIQILTVDLTVLAALSIFAGLILMINILVSKLSEARMTTRLKQEINSLKANEDVFRAFLTKQPHYTLSGTLSNETEKGRIRFGNSGAKLNITILSNPYCNPCAGMHKRVEKLLKTTSHRICIEYILSSFSEELESTNKYLIAVVLQKPDWQEIFGIWFERGKSQRDDFFKDMGLDMSLAEIEDVYQRHKQIKEEMKLQATPTILVNGYKLPENYKIEDLQYFTDIDSESNKCCRFAGGKQ
jgi:hypothetical protein